MLNGLSLFTGIGGIDLALSEWVRPVAYCEVEPYAAAVLFSRMSDGALPTAPVFPDVRHLTKEVLPNIDIVYGGFPCQDISVAGKGEGLGGKRSGLFFEIMRLVDEVRPSFIFLENVPAILTRGGVRIAEEITARRYDCRWSIVSAAEVGARHIRKRWWLLAYTSGNGRHELHHGKQKPGSERKGKADTLNDGTQGNVIDTDRKRLEGAHSEGLESRNTPRPSWWPTKPPVCGGTDEVSCRVDRIKCLGNAVVPQCAKEAFKRLMGLDNQTQNQHDKEGEE